MRKDPDHGFWNPYAKNLVVRVRFLCSEGCVDIGTSCWGNGPWRWHPRSLNCGGVEGLQAAEEGSARWC